ncbi:MAG: hypothetical protein GF410_06235 [Chitinivibrionales bacterium]|nr:hypothetical protein [Chitinivibrionales bacterium]
MIFLTGVSVAIVQVVLVREYLTVFSGNELALGLVFGVWLFAAGAGSAYGTRGLSGRHDLLCALLLALGCVFAFLATRYARTLFDPGAAIPPSAIVLLLASTEGVPAFVGGCIFGMLSREAGNAPPIYAFENAGGLLGACIVFMATLFALTNAQILALALIPLAVVLSRKPVPVAVLVACIAIVVGTGTRTASWKYAASVESIHYGREGEVALVTHNSDTSVLLNNTLYRTTLDVARIEQAAHLAASQRAGARRALVIFDRGYAGELRKYEGLHVDVLETHPVLAGPGAIVAAPERFRPRWPYDLIVLGSGMPDNAATSRFYTPSFYRRMRSLMTPDGVLTFTLPFSENYLSSQERELYDVIRNSLRAMFSSVLVFPGDGYTFMASGGPLGREFAVGVRTEYLEPYVLPSVDAERIALANGPPSHNEINRADRPIALVFALRDWMRMFGRSTIVLVIVLVAVIMIGALVLPKTRGVLSVSTSGFATGVYSISLMLLFQSVYGTLYSQVAFLLAALTVGFVAGSRVRKLPASDLQLGAYAVVSLLLLSYMPQPPVLLFFAAHLGMGFFSGAQFVTRKDTALGMINASDLFGGVAGMALASTVLVPLWGIVPVAVGIFGMKSIVWLVSSNPVSRLKA